MSERKRSKGPGLEDPEETRRPKKQKLEESSSHSEQEISVHARLDEGDFLNSPASGSGQSHSSPVHYQSHDSPSRQEASDSEAFPLVKGEAVGEKRKVRRYRGTADPHGDREKELWEANERGRRKRSHSQEPEERTRERHRRVKHSSSVRVSPQHREPERPRRGERGERGPYLTREHSLKRRVDDWREREREESRRASYPRDERRERSEPYDSRRLETRDLLRWREDRDRHLRERPMRPERRPLSSGRSEVRERHLRPPRTAREKTSRDRDRDREHDRERAEKERERYHHKHRGHHREEVKLEKVAGKGRSSGESASDSDESPEKEHPESEKIEDLIKELEEGEQVSSSESEQSGKDDEGQDRVSGESFGSESEVVGGTSDVSDVESGVASPEENRKLQKSVSEVVERTDMDDSTPPAELRRSKTEPGVMRTKFDVDDDEEGEAQSEGVKRPVRKGYSGYEAFAASDASEEEEEVEDVDAERGDQGSEEIEEEEEASPTPELPPYLPALMGCRNVENYEWLNRIEEGTYGVVYRAKDKRTEQIVALKKLKMEKEKEGFPITSLREINMLLKAKHPNIVHVREIVVGSNMDKIYIVMDYVEHDLKSLMETMKQPFLEGEVKTLTVQLLRAVHHLHDNWILHRDLKASNLLLSHKGILKVGDFGLAREYGSPLKPYTPVVVTLWYRAPELLLGVKEYSTAVDMWSVGCIFAEFLLHKPLFQGKSEIDQLNQIFKELGTPSEEIWPGYNELPFVKKVTFTKQPYNHLRKRFPYLTHNGFDMLNRFLTYDPKKRITADRALKHEYFKESPLPVDPSMFPTWPARSEMVRKKRERSPQAPEGGAFKFNKDDDEETMGFRLTQAQHGQAAVGAGFSLKF